MIPISPEKLDLEAIDLAGDPSYLTPSPPNGPLPALERLSRVNILVGPTNGGKSRLLRQLLRLVEYRVRLRGDPLRAIRAAYQRYCEVVPTAVSALGFSSLGPITEQATKEHAPPDRVVLGKDTFAPFRAYFELVRDTDYQSAVFSISGSGSRSHRPDIARPVQDAARDVLNAVASCPYASAPSPAPQRIYLPTLRTVRQIANGVPGKGAADDHLAARIASDHFPQAQAATPKIYTGQTMYADVRSMLLGDFYHRTLVRKWEDFLAKSVFRCRRVTIIPNEALGVLCVAIDREAEQPIHELGDGIQSALILTLPAFTESFAFIFIEEPEIFLHPGLQRTLLGCFTNAGPHVYFVATHSNHFLDMSMDFEHVSTFTLRKCLPPRGDIVVPTFVVTQVDGPHAGTLALLGVRNSSVFLANATVWVEGITDRLYFRRLLELSAPLAGPDALADALPAAPSDLREDVDFAFIEYGGANLPHFDFSEARDSLDKDAPIWAERLCGRAIVIADEDAGRKAESLQGLRTILRERLLVLPCREVENLLPPSVLLAVIREYERNEDLTLDLPFSAYRHEYLGAYIDEQLGDKRKRTGTYGDSSGTLRDKVGFCRKALSYMKDLGDFDPEVQEFVRTLRGQLTGLTADTPCP